MSLLSSGPEKEGPDPDVVTRSEIPDMTAN